MDAWGGGLSDKNKPAKKLRRSVGDELDGVGIAEGVMVEW